MGLGKDSGDDIVCRVSLLNRVLETVGAIPTAGPSEEYRGTQFDIKKFR